MDIIEQIKINFSAFLTRRFSISDQLAASCTITLNTDSQKQQFGDLSSNAALILAKHLHQSPRVLAQTIAAEFTDPAVATIEVAGPGFINFFLTADAFIAIARMLFLAADDFFKLPDTDTRYHYNVEFVSANPTGPLHLGHGRGGIIGDTLSRILRFLGHRVTSEFYINDAGSQIEKLGNSFKIRCMQALGKSEQLPQDGYQGDYLIELARSCAAQYGTDLFTKDDSFFSTYAQEHLLAHIKETLAAYRIHFDVWFSEKELHTSGAIEHALDYLQVHQQTYVKEEALWFKSTAYGDDKDRVIKKANGELTYVAADVAYLQDKINRKANHLIMVLGQDHHSYVVRLHALQKAMNLDQIPLDIILYQLVSIKEGGEKLRMSKRAGRMVTLEEIIELVGVDVARFFYLHRKADAHLEFDLDLALKQTDENPVYYVQYAYVRIHSILEKAAHESAFSHISPEDALHLADEERLLLKKIVELKELLKNISQNYQTHLLTYYVIELADAFHKYYAQARVIQSDKSAQSRARLLLLMLVQKNFAIVLNLLGISMPQRM